MRATEQAPRGPFRILERRYCLAEIVERTLDDLRESMTTFEETAPIARRVLGTTHPTANGIGIALETSRAALRARETPSGSGSG